VLFSPSGARAAGATLALYGRRARLPSPRSL